jgi:hypothetical protein
MMVSQFELKIMSEIDPGSILPSAALTDHRLIALPRVNTKRPRQDRLVSASGQSAVYASHSAALPHIAVVIRPINRALV